MGATRIGALTALAGVLLIFAGAHDVAEPSQDLFLDERPDRAGLTLLSLSGI
jgi:hypothetical protein